MTQQQKVLLVGSSFSAAPIFFALKKKGFSVTVCGNDPNDPCHQYADASLYFDYSVKEKLLEATASGDFAYLVPTCNDYSYLSCAWVAEQRKFPGFDTYKTTQIMHTKDQFREFLRDHNFPIPKAVRYEAGKKLDISSLKYPLLVKPVDSFSGKGVTKITRPDELTAAIEMAAKSSRSSGVIIEEFVEGTLHSHSAFIHKQNIVCDFFVDEYCTVYPYQVNCSYHPSALPEKIRAGMKREMSRLADLLRLADGLIHTQFITNGEQFWIIECMRRHPGDLYGRLITLSTGIDYADYFSRPFVNQVVPATAEITNPKFMGRHTISGMKPVVVSGFSHNIPAKNIEIVPLKGSGERLGVAPNDKLGILFMEFADRAEMLRITPRLDQYITVHPLDTPPNDSSQK